MGGEGSIQSMITTLRNNKQLLRKRKPFRSGFGFARLREDYRKYSEGRIESEPITKEELSEIRQRILRQHRKDNLISGIVLLLLVSFAVVFSVKIYIGLQEYQVEQNEVMLRNNTQKYLFYIEDGDKWLNKGKYHNAIFQYSLAKEIYTSEYDVNYRLALAYAGKCRFEGSGCDKGQKILQELIVRFPERNELFELQGYFD